MITLQEYLNQKYPTEEEKKGLKRFNSLVISTYDELEGQWFVDLEVPIKGDLDLSEFTNLEEVYLSDSWCGDRVFETSRLKLNNLSRLKTLIVAKNCNINSIELSDCGNLTELSFIC